MSKKLELRRGDRIQISALGVVITGTVDHATNYGDRPYSPADCWYIEMTDDRDHCHYWRQDSDGGTVVKLSPATR